jgi:hypothetical protein
VSQLSSHDLPLPVAPETAAFRMLETILKNDSAVQRHVRTFISWHDTTQSLLEPHDSMRPYLRISALPAQSNWITELQHDSPLAVQITIATDGLNIDNLMNWWSVIRSAIFPQDLTHFQAVTAKFASVGVLRPIVTLNGFGSMMDERERRLLVAVGTIRLAMHIHT